MDKDQKKYACARIRDVLRDKLRVLNEAHTVKSPEPSDKEKIIAIRDCDVSLKNGVGINTPLKDAFNFSKMATSEAIDDSKEYRAKVRDLERQANVALDAIMLKDEEEAKKLIDLFCK